MKEEEEAMKSSILESVEESGEEIHSLSRELQIKPMGKSGGSVGPKFFDTIR